MIGTIYRNMKSRIKNRGKEKNDLSSPENEGEIYRREKRKGVRSKKKRKKKSSSGTGTIGYVLIGSTGKGEHDVFNKIKEHEEVIEIHPLYGEFSAIAKIGIDKGTLKEGETYKDVIDNYVEDKIRSIEGVTDTKILTGIKF